MNITEMTASEIVTAIAENDLSAAEVAVALIEAAERWRAINAVVRFDPERFLADAKAADEAKAAGKRVGALHGLPLVIKDNIDIAGFATSAATPSLAGNMRFNTAPAMQKLLDAGALVMAKANMHEMAFSPGVVKPADGGDIVWGAYGPARNPYNLERSPAGSSSGTGAAIAARIAPAGLGSDTGGSVRMPAAWCGIAGLRPTMGRYEQDGVVPISWTRDTIGPMARTAADLALLDGVVTGETVLPNARLENFTFGVNRDFFCTDCDPGHLAAFEAELTRLSDAGAEVVDIELPDFEPLLPDGQTIARYEFHPALEKYLDGTGVTVDGLVAAAVSSGLGPNLAAMKDAVSEANYARAMNQVRPAFQRAYTDAFTANRLDAIVLPATLLPPTHLQEQLPFRHKGRDIPSFIAAYHNVQPASIGGSPGLTMGIGLTEAGLPAAIGFDAPVGADRKLLAIGIAYEAIKPPMPAPTLAA